MTYAESKMREIAAGARADYGWDIDYELVDVQETGIDSLYTFIVEVDGQYAEHDAVDYFEEMYAISAVVPGHSEHSYQQLEVQIYGQ